MPYGNTPDFDPFSFRLNAKSATIGSTCCIELPISLIPFIMGALEGLAYPNAWEGQDSDIVNAMKIIETAIAEFTAVINNCNNSSGSYGIDMANNCVQCPPFRIEAGILQWYNCGTWQDIGPVGSGGQSDENVDYPPVAEWEVEPVEGVEPDFACVKATAVVRTVCDLLTTFKTTWNDFKLVSNTENAVGYDLHDKWLQLMAAEMLKIKIVSEATLGLLTDELDAFCGEVNQQTMICQLSPRMDGVTGRFTDEDWSVTQRYFLTVEKSLLAEFLITAAPKAIGKANFDRAFIVNANNAFDCGCPEIAPDPNEIPDGVLYTWSAILDFTQGDYGFVAFGNGGATYEPGVGWTYSATDFDSARLPKVRRYGDFASDPAKLTYARLFIGGWPTSPVLGGDGYVYLDYGGQQIAGSGWIGQPYLSGFWQNPGGMSGSIYMAINPSDLYWSAAANPGYKTVVSKLILAGIEGDGWSRLQPDGTFATP